MAIPPHFSQSLTTTKLFFPFPIHTTPLFHHLRIPTTTTISCSYSSSPQAAAISEAVSQATNSLPCVRTYETDTARLSLTGSVGFEQALTAASADGGQAADEHIVAGLDVMVVETLFPAPIDDRSTISTRLFLPAKKVKEKAKKLRSSLPKEVLSGTNSRNILAMTFRQVVIQQLLGFDLAVFVPGSHRNMDDLGSQREVALSFALSSSDENAISRLAEAICILALETTQKEVLNGSVETKSDGFFGWFSKTKKFTSNDCSVILYRIGDDVIVENARSLLDMYNASRANYTIVNTKTRGSTWTSAMHSKLEKIGGLEFTMWTSEHVPAYRLEINADRLTDLKFEHWKRVSGNKWEVLLTHSQMVGLANVLDMYFEDRYSLPGKQLISGGVRSPRKLLKNKAQFSFLGFLRTTVVVAAVVISVGVLVKLFLPNLYSSRKRSPGEYQVLSSENNCKEVQPVMLEAYQLEAYSSALVQKLKDYYSWNGDIKFDPKFGAWIGEIPHYLKDSHVADVISKDVLSSTDVLAASDEQLKSSIQEIASYQVVLSTDGRIVGFQPTSRVAVNHWAANPIAKELHGGKKKKLSPGLLEPGLHIKKPDNVIVLELLMSLNKDDYFALVRQLL